jgi:hypothetical protein
VSICVCVTDDRLSLESGVATYPIGGVELITSFVLFVARGFGSPEQVVGMHLILPSVYWYPPWLMSVFGSWFEVGHDVNVEVEGSEDIPIRVIIVPNRNYNTVILYFMILGIVLCHHRYYPIVYRHFAQGGMLPGRRQPVGVLVVGYSDLTHACEMYAGVYHFHVIFNCLMLDHGVAVHSISGLDAQCTS